MKNLAHQLKVILSKNNLETFEWTIPANCPIDIPQNISTDYEKNIHLKKHLHSVILNDHALDSHYWTIQKWGGIGSFKKNERNDARIKKFIDQLSKGELTRDSFSCISSLSKIASFIEPEKYAIYDSRVIYSLNWLLFKDSEDSALFPQPAGRSASLAQYDMQTIFRLTNKPFEFRSYKTAFHAYCSLISELSPLVFGKNCEPYKLEMLLFMIAPTWIIENIKESVAIKFQ